MIVDTHVHFGVWGHIDCPLPELLAESAAAGVDKFVQVTPAAAGWDDAMSFAGMAANPDRILGVIGRFDPSAPDAGGRMKRRSAEQGLLGVRFLERDGEGLRARAYDSMFAAAQEHRVAIHVHAPFQSLEMHAVARRFPELRIVIDHMGVRRGEGNDGSDRYRMWPALMDLASEPNVWIKVSYFPEIAMDSERYPYPNAQRRFQELYKRVGPRRLVWGSNFPPVRRACTYREALDFVRVHCGFLSGEDKDAILGGNFLRDFAPAH